MSLSDFFKKKDKPKVDVSYLQNFWKPRVGDTVKYMNLYTETISEFDKVCPEQVILEDRDDIVFLQDCVWEPQPEQLEAILKSAGMTICDDGYLYKHSWFAKPETIEGYVKLFENLRHMLPLLGGDDLIAHTAGN